jgi:hypothetical protein
LIARNSTSYSAHWSWNTLTVAPEGPVLTDAASLRRPEKRDTCRGKDAVCVVVSPAAIQVMAGLPISVPSVR